MFVTATSALDTGLQRTQFHDEECNLEHLEQDERREDTLSVLCLDLPSFQGRDQSGHVRLQIHGVSSWQPFTVAQRKDGKGELHIKLEPKVQEGKMAPQYANWSFQTKNRVVNTLHYSNRLKIRWTGPFGGVLSNSSPYAGMPVKPAVIFVCWGTGFTAITQGMHSLGHSQAQVFWRGAHDYKKYKKYWDQKVQPICQEYGVRNMLQEWKNETGDLDLFWNRGQFETAILTVIGNHTRNGQKVLVGMCGSSAACNSVTRAIENLGNHNLIEIQTEAFG